MYDRGVAIQLLAGCPVLGVAQNSVVALRHQSLGISASSDQVKLVVNPSILTLNPSRLVKASGNLHQSCSDHCNDDLGTLFISSHFGDLDTHSCPSWAEVGVSLAARANGTGRGTSGARVD